jgi:hypothetical protein
MERKQWLTVMEGLRRMGADIFLQHKTKSKLEDYKEFRRNWRQYQDQTTLNSHNGQ